MTCHLSVEFFDNLPREIRLCGKSIFVCWGYASPRNDFEREYPEKAPIDAKSGKPASVTNSTTWAQYETCVQAVADGRFLGIGIVLSKIPEYCLGLVGLDLDHCVNSQGELMPEAQGIVDALGTYAEYSPSRTGLRLFVRGHISADVKTKVGEIYSDARYLRITGFIHDHFRPIADDALKLQKLWDTFFRYRQPANPNLPIALQDIDFKAPDEAQRKAIWRRYVECVPHLKRQFLRKRDDASVDDYALVKEFAEFYRLDRNNPKHIWILSTLVYMHRSHHDNQSSGLNRVQKRKRSRADYLYRTIARAFADLPQQCSAA